VILRLRSGQVSPVGSASSGHIIPEKRVVVKENFVLAIGFRGQGPADREDGARLLRRGGQAAGTGGESKNQNAKSKMTVQNAKWEYNHGYPGHKFRRLALI